jgi:hypothetical protein
MDVNGERRSVASRRSGQVEFEYVGRTALTVIGAVTGMRYRFAYPGQRVNVDAKDQAGMGEVPVLMQIA